MTNGSLSKLEFSEVLHAAGVTVAEGQQALMSAGDYPKLCYWEMTWDEEDASGDSYGTVVRYQLSYAALRPRDPGLLRLRKSLREHGLRPRIYHESAREEGGPPYIHSYCAVDVLEELPEPEDP